MKNHLILVKFGIKQHIWNSMTAIWPNRNIFKIQDSGRTLF